MIFLFLSGPKQMLATFQLVTIILKSMTLHSAVFFQNDGVCCGFCKCEISLGVMMIYLMKSTNRLQKLLRMWISSDTSAHASLFLHMIFHYKNKPELSVKSVFNHFPLHLQKQTTNISFNYFLIYQYLWGLE